MSFNFYLLFYNIFNKDSRMICQQLQKNKKKKNTILPNELIIIIYKYADNNTKFHLLKIFYWLKNIYLQCYNLHCKNKAKYIIHYKVLSEKCNCIINKEDLFFTNIVCSLNCNNCILLNYHYINQSNYLKKYHFPVELSYYPLKFHTYTRFNKALPEHVRFRSLIKQESGSRLSSGLDKQGSWCKYPCTNSCYNKKCVICLHNFYNEKINMYGIKLLN